MNSAMWPYPVRGKQYPKAQNRRPMNIQSQRPEICTNDSTKVRATIGAAMLFLVSLLGSMPCAASEGLLYASLVHCMDLQERTTQQLAVCATKFPAVSGRTNASLALWLKRNSVDFGRVAKECEGQLRKLLPDSNDFNRYVKNMRNHWTESLSVTNYRYSDVTKCEKELVSLEDESNDLKSWPTLTPK